MTTSLLFVFFIVIYLLLIWKAGKTIPILHLFLFTYFVQYVFSTYLIYYEYAELERQMVIKEDVYFAYANIALLSLFLGVFLFHKEVNLKRYLRIIDPVQASRLGFLLLAISYGVDLLQLLGIPGIGSIDSFTEFLKYPAAFCFLFSNSPIRYLIIGAIYLQLAFIVLRGGVFIHFFIWSTFLFFFFVLKLNIGFWLRASFIVLALPVLILVQTVKDEYREATWENRREGGVGTFTEIAEKENKKNANLPFEKSEGVVRTVGRLSQGWHLGLTLKRVPQRVPFSNAEEMLSDITSSIVPRIIIPDKKIVGSQDKFEKYTGHTLHGTTSMTIGVLGDFYINFGRTGSFIMLFVFGALIAKFLYFFIRRYVINDPINIIWLPFLFNYLIRANNDFYMVFNSTLKGFIIFLFINFVRKQIWPTRRVVLQE